MRILIAEDEATSRRLLEILLRKWGHDVVVTRHGREAWEAFQADDPPPMAILDWMMPGLDGVEICRRIRRMTSAPPVYLILLTARGQKEDTVLGLEAGANDYITKPFDPAELRARIEVGRRVVELQSALAGRVRDLQDALDHVQLLQGLLPICMYCHRIRDDHDTWRKLEEYIESHSDAHFSHGLCPECLAEHHPDKERMQPAGDSAPAKT